MSDSDLADLRKQCITSLYLCTDNVAKYLDNEKEAEFQKLKKYVEEYCTMEAQQNATIQALEKTRRETDSSNVDSLEDRFNNNLRAMAGRGLNVDKHPYMTELTKRIKKGLQTRESMDQSDLAITESQDQYIDPITRKQIVDPVRHATCGHIYEKEAILNLLKIRGRVKCPVAGCGNRQPISENDLICDEELKFRMTITQHSTMIQDRSVTNLDSTCD